MEKLIDKLKGLLATTFAYRLKLQNYHWNIEGPDFVQYHKFLGELYEAADAQIDDIAEHIRALGAYVPGSFSRFSELSSIEDELNVPSADEMFSRLAKDNFAIKKILIDAVALAESENERGILNYVEDLIDKNEKTQWMLDSISKR